MSKFLSELLSKMEKDNTIYTLNHRLICTANAAKVILIKEVKRKGYKKIDDIECPDMKALAENIMKLDELWKQYYYQNTDPYPEISAEN